MGAVIAPLTLLGGPLMVRAAWYTAGIVGGLSTVAMCAPSEKFLSMGGPLAVGFGVVFASSLGESVSQFNRFNSVTSQEFDRFSPLHRLHVSAPHLGIRGRPVLCGGLWRSGPVQLVSAVRHTEGHQASRDAPSLRRSEI